MNVYLKLNIEKRFLCIKNPAASSFRILTTVESPLLGAIQSYPGPGHCQIHSHSYADKHQWNNEKITKIDRFQKLISAKHKQKEIGKQSFSFVF